MKATQKRRHRTSRKSSARKVPVSLPSLTYDTTREAATILGMLVRDKRLGQSALFRIMMCAGAAPHDLFDTEGHAHKTARPILLQMLANLHTPEFVPQCPRDVEAWLKTANATVAEIRAACESGHSSPGTGRRVSSETDEASVAAALVATAKPSTDVSLLLHVAALYIVVRAHRGIPSTRMHKVPHTALAKRLLAVCALPDMPHLQASEDYRPDKQKTYATTDDCLKGVHDDGLRALFVEHTTLTALRKHLLLRRKPVFFHQRRLMNEHLIRPDGTPRTSIAEIAYAVKHEWDNKSVVDAAVSKFAAMMRRIGQAFV